MADDPSKESTERSGEKATSQPLSEQVRAAAVEAARELHGRLPVSEPQHPGQSIPSHSPDASDEDNASGEKAQGKSLSQEPPTFAQRLESLRQSLPDLRTLEHALESHEPYCQ